MASTFSATFIKLFFKSCLIILALSLGACASNTHSPYILKQIQPRAQSIARQTHGQLSPQLATIALIAYNKAQMAGFGYGHVYTIIDYSLPSTTPRLWVIDLANNKVLFQERVAHGIGSGQLYARQFSDHVDSKESCVGMCMTAANGYVGRHGYALRLIGLEPGFNGQAFTRSIVFHSASYVSIDYIKTHGYIGQTWGCPAVNPQNLASLINTIKGGTLFFVYGNDANWHQHSMFLPHSQTSAGKAVKL